LLAVLCSRRALALACGCRPPILVMIMSLGFIGIVILLHLLSGRR
jgi:hypothetical protein